MDWDRERGPGFLLMHHDTAAPDVLTSEADNVASTLAGVERERECKVRFATERMLRFELCDLLLGPSGIAPGVAAAIWLHAECGIAGEQANRDGVAKNCAQYLE